MSCNMLVEGVLCGEHFVTNLTSKPYEARPLPHHRRGRRLHLLQNISLLVKKTTIGSEFEVMPLSYTAHSLRALNFTCT